MPQLPVQQEVIVEIPDHLDVAIVEKTIDSLRQPVGKLHLLAELKQEPTAVSVMQATRLPDLPAATFWQSPKPQYLCFTTTLFLVRVSGAEKDDLQAAMQLARKSITDLPLQFINFRD